MDDAAQTSAGLENQALVGQNRVLELIATGAPLADVLTEIINVIGGELSTPLCILLVDCDRKHLRLGAATPGIESLARACDGLPIGPTSGSCGRAAFLGETVLVSDIATEPVWSSFRQLADAVGMRACLSVPIVSRGRDGSSKCVLGTFAIYAPEPGSDFASSRVVAKVEHLTCIALEANDTLRRLRESEARFRAYVDHASDALFIHAADCTILDVNRAACASLGYTRDELIGQHPSMFDKDISPEHIEELKEQISRGETATIHSRYVRKDGTRFPVEVRTREVTKSHRLSIMRDVSERVAAETALRTSEASLHHAQTLAHIGNWTYDETADEWNASKEFWRICGFAAGPQTGKAVLSIVHPEDVDRVLQTSADTKQGHGCELEHRILVNGEIRWLHVRTDPGVPVNGRVTVITGTSQDITERRRLEDQLRQKQKLEAIGQLAGGVAHDFNNILTIINGLSDELVTQLPPGGEARQDVIAIRDAGERAAALTAQLLAFGRRTILELTLLDLNAALDRLGGMLRRLIREDVSLSMKLAVDLAPIEVDHAQLDQVVVNLALNARDAMPHGGVLTISTRNRELRSSDTTPDLPPGKYVELSVTDTGIGMSDEIKARLFEPFFTTKEVGRGTGLGLATTYGIVKQARGHISVETKLNRGSTFSILFPAVEKRAILA